MGGWVDGWGDLSTESGSVRQLYTGRRAWAGLIARKVGMKIMPDGGGPRLGFLFLLFVWNFDWIGLNWLELSEISFLATFLPSFLLFSLRMTLDHNSALATMLTLLYIWCATWPPDTIRVEVSEIASCVGVCHVCLYICDVAFEFSEVDFLLEPISLTLDISICKSPSPRQTVGERGG